MPRYAMAVQVGDGIWTVSCPLCRLTIRQGLTSLAVVDGELAYHDARHNRD